MFELEATPFDYAAWRDVSSLSNLALVRRDAFTLDGDDDTPERVRGSRVSATLMPMLGVPTQLGRGFTADEDSDEAAAVVVLSDGIWRRRYGADPSILDGIVRINAVPHTVVGVMPRAPRCRGPLAGDDVVWLPAPVSPRSATTPSATTTPSWRGWPTASRSRARRRSSRRLPCASRRSIPTASGDWCTPRADGRADGAHDQAGAARDCRRCRAPAPGRVRECGDAADGPRGGEASRDSRPSGARRVAPAALLTGDGGVSALLLARRRRRPAPRARWSLGALLPLFAASLPASASVGIDGRAALFALAVTLVLGVAFGCVVALHNPRALSDALEQVIANRRGRVGTLAHGAGRRAGDARRRAAVFSGADVDERDEARSSQARLQPGARR